MHSFRHPPAAVGMGPAGPSLNRGFLGQVHNHIGLAHRRMQRWHLIGRVKRISRVRVDFFLQKRAWFPCGSLLRVEGRVGLSLVSHFPSAWVWQAPESWIERKLQLSFSSKGTRRWFTSLQCRCWVIRAKPAPRWLRRTRPSNTTPATRRYSPKTRN